MELSMHVLGGNAAKGPRRRRRTCLNPHCRSATYARGLCRACYAAAYRLVATGRATWEDLEDKDRVLPAHALSRRNAEARVAWLLEDAAVWRRRRTVP